MNTHRAAGSARMILDPKVRKYIYGVSIPLIALLVGLGYVDEGTSALILTLVGAVLGVGTSTLAVANTDAGSPGREDGYPAPDVEA